MTFIVIFFTRSRGGFLGLCVVTLLISLRSKYKLIGLIAAPLAIVLMLAFAPSVVTERINTIQGARPTPVSTAASARGARTGAAA